MGLGGAYWIKYNTGGHSSIKGFETDKKNRDVLNIKKVEPNRVIMFGCKEVGIRLMAQFQNMLQMLSRVVYSPPLYL